MSKIKIKVALPVNITNLEGFYVVTEANEHEVVLYGIATQSEDRRQISDIELALNSSAHSMNIIPLDSITENIQSVAEQLENYIATLEEKLRLARLRQQKLVKTERQCVAYYSNNK